MLGQVARSLVPLKQCLEFKSRELKNKIRYWKSFASLNGFSRLDSDQSESNIIPGYRESQTKRIPLHNNEKKNLRRFSVAVLG